jgi:Helix-turn-helix domain
MWIKVRLDQETMIAAADLNPGSFNGVVCGQRGDRDAGVVAGGFMADHAVVDLAYPPGKAFVSKRNARRLSPDPLWEMLEHLSDPFRLLGAFIGSERRRAGLTQREVAARLGQSQGWLSRIECGPRQRIDVVELLALADVIGFNPVEALRVLRRPQQHSSR